MESQDGGAPEPSTEVTAFDRAALDRTFDGNGGAPVMSGSPLLEGALAGLRDTTGDLGERVDPRSLPVLPAPGPGRSGPPFGSPSEEEAEEWRALASDYEREAKALGEDPRAAGLFVEVGRIYEEHLGRPRNAATAYQRAFALSPYDPTVLHASRRLFTEAGNWPMVVQLLGHEIDCAETPQRRATLLSERGAILENKLGAPDQAIIFFRQALEAWSAEPLAIDALERLHLFKREYAELYDVYRRALEVHTKARRRVSLLIAAAQLAEDRLDRPEDAFAHYAEALEIEGGDAFALAALRRLSSRLERWAEFVEAHERSAAAAGDPREAAQYWVLVARVQHERLGQPDKALRSLLFALEKAPEDLGILHDIERLYAVNLRYDEVVKVLSREAEVTREPRDRVPVLYKLGTVYEDHLSRPEEAIAVYRRAVELMPSYLPARQALGRILGRTGRWQDLAELFELEIRLEEDLLGRVVKLYKLAELRDARLDRHADAIAALREVLRLKPDYQPARKYLERLLQEREAWPELIDLYEQDVELTEDREQKVFILGRIGMLAEEKLGALEGAAHAYQRILDLSPGHFHAIQTLARIYTKLESWSDVLKMYELEVEATEDQKEVVAILYGAGVVVEEKLGQIDLAIERYEKVLSLNPSYLPALRSLGRLYHLRGRWDDLLSMYYREIEVMKSSEQVVGLLFRISDVLRGPLKDDARAAKVLERVLELHPDNLAALRALDELYQRLGEPERVIDVLRREGDSLEDSAEKARTLIRLGELSERLKRTDEAAAAYRRVLTLGYFADVAMRALVRIYTAGQEWPALHAALVDTAEQAGDTATRVRLLLQAAEVSSERLGDLDAASERLIAARALDPENQTVLGQLQRVCVARRDWSRAVEVSEALAALEPDPRVFAAWHIRIAAMKETQLDPPESGAEHYRRVLETVPDHPVALRALELAYLHAANWQGLSQLYEREAMVSPDAGKSAALFSRAAEVAERRLGDHTRAASLYDRAIDLSPLLLPAIRGRKRTADRLGQREVALDCVRREGEATGDENRARELLFESGRIFREQGELEKAVKAFETVLSRGPDHEEAFAALEAIYREKGLHQEHVELLEKRAASRSDAPAQARFLFAAAEAAELRAGDRARALRLYREVLEREPLHEGALARVAPLYVEEARWAEAHDAYERILSATQDPAGRFLALKALGAIYQEPLPDPVKCVQALQAALAIEPADLECLERLSAVYGSAEDWRSAVNVLLRMAEVSPGREGKVKTLGELAQIYERLQDHANAALAYRKVLELMPKNEQAIHRLMELFEGQGEWAKLVEVTSTYVGMLQASDRAKAVPVYLKLAEIFHDRLQDSTRAATALKQALEIDARSVPALERMAAIRGAVKETMHQAIDVHRRLLAIDPFRAESYHELHRLFLRRGEHDKAFVAAEVLVFLRAQKQDEDLYYNEHKSKVAPQASAELSAADHQRLVVHPREDAPVRAVLEILSGELSKLYPGDLTKYELNPRTDRHGPKSTNAVRKLADELARVLGAPPFDLWVTQRQAMELFLENEKPTALIVGAQIPRRVQEKDQRFMLARQLERMRGGHHLLERIPPEEILILLWTIARMADPAASVPASFSPEDMEAMLRRLAKTLSGKARKALEESAKGLAPSEEMLGQHAGAARQTAYRAALVLTNDIEIAIRNIVKGHPNVRPVFMDAIGAAKTIGKVPDVGELLGYAVSEEYFAARAKLGFSIEDAAR